MEPAVVTFPPGIDPGECIVAVVGVRPFLTDKIERITAPMWREIQTLPARIEKMAQQLARGTLEKQKPYPEVDYDTTLSAFSEPPDPDQVMAMLQDVPARAALQFLVVAARAYNTLRPRYPICVERTVFGATELRPSDMALGMFEDLFEIVDDPLRVFDMVRSGRLTTLQAAIGQQVYPMLYKAIATAVVDKCLDEKAAHSDKWEPEFGRGLAVLLGVPGVDPALRDHLAAPPPQPEQAAPPPGRGGRSSRARLIATKSDRLELED